jgi:DNA processing protein
MTADPTTVASDAQRVAAAGLARHARPEAEIAARVMRDGIEETWRWYAGRCRAAGREVPDPRRDLDAAAAAGAHLLLPGEPGWPESLAVLAHAAASSASRLRAGRGHGVPFCLWVRGQAQLDTLVGRSAAVVGARAATDYGVWVASEIAVGLAERKATVISGGAFGIDAAAHRGALATSGMTVAVLAGGVDVPYPRAHDRLLDAVAEGGALVTEMPPGTRPRREGFLVRNRLIAALAGGVVLVEAGLRSGARNTMAHAAALGRPRMAVPGPVTSAMSAGCHRELRDDPQVRVVTSAAEVLEEVGRLGDDLARRGGGALDPRDDLGDRARDLLERLPSRGSWSVDRIARELGLRPVEALGIAGALADHGLLVRAGDRFGLSALGRQPSAR